MGKNSKDIINYERDLPQLIEEMNEKIENTSDSALLESYKHDLCILNIKQIQLETFKKMISQDVLDSVSRKKYLDRAFQLINLATFGGFDCYYPDDLDKRLDDNKKMYSSNNLIDVYINKEQLNKLMNVVDCFDEITFMSYYGEDGKDKYAVWYDGTPIYINLIPFERTEENEIILENEKYEFQSSDSSYKEIPYRVLLNKKCRTK